MSGVFNSVLVANRGEIACRVIRTLRAMGIRSIAVYSDADRNSRHVSEADEAIRIGPAIASQSYLSIPAVVQAAKDSGAQAVHPGYGFLSENAELARACEEAGIVFIGPGLEALAVMGDKIRAKEHVAAAGVPTIRGVNSPGMTDLQLAKAAEEIGFPILIKPSAGGGGKGMVPVYKAAELPEALATARRVAKSSFGDDTLLLERLVARPRHIEVQLMADAHGNVIHLGERECSLQRRHQKVIEEAPSVLLSPETRARIGEAACTVARSVSYLGAGTVEFLVSAESPDEFFFMEMNTRLQVEHPVTEMVTGLDLVEWQLRVAAGEVLSIAQEDVRLEGHAIEARVYAEDPERGFLPSTGRVLKLREPRGEGIRLDSSLEPDLEIPADYDPMLAKVIAWAPTRELAVSRLGIAISEFTILGLRTNLEYLNLLLEDQDVREGNLDTDLIERKLPGLSFRHPDPELLAAAAAWLSLTEQQPAGAWTSNPGWRFGGVRVPSRRLFEWAQVDSAEGETSSRRSAEVYFDGKTCTIGDSVLKIRVTAGMIEIDGITSNWQFAREADTLWVGLDSFSIPLTIVSRTESVRRALDELQRGDGPASPELRSPMPGTVVSVPAADGELVAAGETLVVIEAMKMEHKLVAPIPGIARIRVKVGELVKLDEIVASVETIEPADPSATANGAAK